MIRAISFRGTETHTVTTTVHGTPDQKNTYTFTRITPPEEDLARLDEILELKNFRQILEYDDCEIIEPSSITRTSAASPKRGLNGWNIETRDFKFPSSNFVATNIENKSYFKIPSISTNVESRWILDESPSKEILKKLEAVNKHLHKLFHNFIMQEGSIFNMERRLHK